MAMKIISVTDIEGFKIGNAENSEKGTGCTVIVCEEGAVGGVDVRGGGPATRETDLLRSENTVNSVNAVVLSGGSAFGLESASGVMRELADKGIGFNVIDDIHVPIVCGASLFDLPAGDSKAFPDIYMGMQAVRNAYDGHFARGNHGAGTGATVGKLKGYDRAMKSGLGAFACGDGVIEVGAVAAVNAVGDIYNGAGNIIAGLRSEDGKSIFGTIKTLKGMVHDKVILDDNTSFISRNEIEEALAAAARQYEEEEADVEAVTEEAVEEPAEQVIAEPAEVIEDPAEEAAYETPEENAEESAEVFTEEIAEEPVAEAVEETAEEIIEATDDGSAETIEGPAEEDAEEQEEEFIPETPRADISAESFRGYDEISIPAADASPADDTSEEAAEEPVEEPAEAVDEETTEESTEEFTDEPVEETAEETAVEAPEETAEEVTDEPAEEAAEVSTVELAAEEIIEAADEGSSETIEGPAEETAEEIAEETAEEVPEETAEVSAEVFVDEPAEEITEEEDRPVLTREEMGYDIVFNTTISCLITNAALTKSQANKLASILHDAYARAIKPVHGTLDGDTVFVLSTGKQEVNFDAFAALATDVMQYAIIDGAMSAEGAYGLPAAKDMQK